MNTNSIKKVLAAFLGSLLLQFIVDESGAVFEKDLSSNTTKLAETMTAYDLDSTWHQVEQVQKESF